MSSKKLWDDGNAALDKLIEAYTVGDDYITDMGLLPYDLLASRAHGAMLHKKGILSDTEWHNIQIGLDEIAVLLKDGRFVLRPEQEDGHTAIEQFLTERHGDAGKKIHTGRSRNDQALVMLRLFMKERLGQIFLNVGRLVAVFRASAEKYRHVPMPGYTHIQRAMPTTVGTWLGSFADAWADFATQIPGMQKLIDQNPLGSASGFGITNFENDRSYTTRQLGFYKVQENPIYCAFSRGLFENVLLANMGHFMLIAGRFANDMLLFTSGEFNFFSLPKQFTTGSSIMPQKRNYDIFEIMRGNVRRYLHWQRSIEDIVAGLFSGYQRDLQLTKKPFVNALTMLENTLSVLVKIVPEIKVNEDFLKAALSDDIFLTDRLYDLVNQGHSFRDAYFQVKKNWITKKTKK